MSHPVSRIEITAGSIAVSGPAPGVGVEADRGLVVLDTFGGFGVHYGLGCFLVNNSLGTDYRSVYTVLCYYPIGGTYTTGAVDTPMLWQAVFVGMTSDIYQIALDDSGASFLAGGTLAIEKDYDSSTITFITPAGNMVVPLDTVAAVGVGALSDNEFDSGFWHSLYWNGIDTPVSESALWTDFKVLSAGTPIDGAAMTHADPGYWGIPPVAAFTQIAAADLQDTLGYHSEFSWAEPTNPESAKAAEYRQWRFNTRGTGLSSARVPEHGAILTAYAGPADLTTVNVTTTFDNGRTNPVFPVVGAGAGAAVQGVSVAWCGQRAYIVYGDLLTGLMQTSSFDFGQTWSTPVSLSITGTNPTLLVDPFHGIQFYFYIDASGNLQLVRSADYGQTFIDATPHLVAASITPQTIAAEFTSDGNLLVGFIASGAWTQLRSLDYGLTFS